MDIQTIVQTAIAILFAAVTVIVLAVLIRKFNQDMDEVIDNSQLISKNAEDEIAVAPKSAAISDISAKAEEKKDDQAVEAACQPAKEGIKRNEDKTDSIKKEDGPDTARNSIYSCLGNINAELDEEIRRYIDAVIERQIDQLKQSYNLKERQE